MRHAVLCVVLLLFATPLAPVVVGAAVDAGTDDPAPVAEGGPGHAADGGDTVSHPSLGAPDDHVGLVASFTAVSETELRVVLQENRNARWIITVTYELDDENETAAFREIGDSFVDGDAGPSVDPFRNYAAGASEATGREMEILDVERSVDVEEDSDTDAVEGENVHAVGEFRLAFTWTNFLESDDDRLVLGDAFLTPEETTWLRSLGPDQTLYIRTPEDHSIQSTPGVTVDLRDNALVVEGPRTFESDERVMAVYEPTVGPGPEAPPWGLLAGAVVVAGLIVAGALLVYRRRDGRDAPAARTPPADGRGSANGGDPRPAAAIDAGANDDTADAAASDENGAETDLSLLSDEERVERLLERNGGRMRQADIVDETGWSDAKVSQLLSAMADDGRVEKLRLGRENLISLPDGEETA